MQNNVNSLFSSAELQVLLFLFPKGKEKGVGGGVGGGERAEWSGGDGTDTDNIFLENKLFTHKSKRQIKPLVKHFHWKDRNLSRNFCLKGRWPQKAAGMRNRTYLK